MLVKGMKIPELYETYKVNFAKTNDGKIVMGMCPLNETSYRPVGEVVALPDKHGRLVDADELIKFVEDRYEITWESDCYEGGIKDACCDILEKIDTMPPIVEAEDGT